MIMKLNAEYHGPAARLSRTPMIMLVYCWMMMLLPYYGNIGWLLNVSDDVATAVTWTITLPKTCMFIVLVRRCLIMVWWLCCMLLLVDFVLLDCLNISCLCHVCCETLRVLCEKTEFELHWPSLLFYWWGPIRTFPVSCLSCVVLLSNAEYYTNAIRWLIVWPFAMSSCSYFIQLFINFHNSF